MTATPKNAMMVSDLLCYTAVGTTLRDIATVVGSITTLQDEMQIATVIERADTIAALRKRALKNAEAVMQSLRAPHHNCNKDDMFIYIGNRIGEMGRFRAYKVSRRPELPQHHPMPTAVAGVNALLVFWVYQQPVGENGEVRWVCKYYSGDPILFGDLFAPNTEFLVTYKKPE